MTRKLKFILLLLLSMTSVYFAEVIAGSSKFPFYDFWGIAIVLPLYGLHTIILLFLIKKHIRNRKVFFATLYFAGTIFGLYEAYLTKVLWVGLSPNAVIFFHIAWMDFFVLVFLWHPVFAFIVPILIFEKFMTKDDYLYKGLPIVIQRILENKIAMVFVAIIFGLFMSLNAVDPLQLLLSGILNAIPIIFLYYLLRTKGIHQEYSFIDILPTKKEIRICVGILIVMYIVMGIFIQGEVLTLSNQLVIWGFYILFGVILYTKIKINQNVLEEATIKKEVNLRASILYFLIFVFSGSLITMLWVFGIRDIFMMTIWLIWIVLGLILFLMTLLKKSSAN